jgi:hypothetical protein
MRLIQKIDHGIRQVVFAIFWWFIDPLEPNRLYRQLVDEMDRNLDLSDPHRLLAPDNFNVLVNNTVFIKHSHVIKTIESTVRDRLQKYMAEKDYELPEPLLKLQIISSATISRRKAEIRCWFTPEVVETPKQARAQTYYVKVTEGEGQGLAWEIKPGNTYHIGRASNSDIYLPFDHISKRQATLYFMSNSRISIVDEGSANGTFIGDEEERIKGSRELQIGDQIKFCKLNPIVLTLTSE